MDTGYIDTLRKTRPANSRWKILVLDAYTKIHLNYLMTTYQALEEGVQRESECLKETIAGWEEACPAHWEL